MAQFHWDPEAYLDLIHQEVPDYEHLQEQAAAATGSGATRVLELGIGTGEIARRARQALPDDRVELRFARLEDPLPDGPFDVVISALAIHHLDDHRKAQLFRRAAGVLSPGGRLVVADLVIPDDPSDMVTPIDNDYDTAPSPISSAGLLKRDSSHPYPGQTETSPSSWPYSHRPRRPTSFRH